MSIFDAPVDSPNQLKGSGHVVTAVSLCAIESSVNLHQLSIQGVCG
jgi:hypothetical protein